MARFFQYFITIPIILLILQPVIAQEKRVEIGVLDCDISAGINLIITSNETMKCHFKRADGTPDERYIGKISKFGLDFGSIKKSHLVWGVFAPSAAFHETGRLAGTYFGVSAEASLGVGLGANVLLGGFKDSFALQPFSLQTQDGVNIAVGVSKLVLSAEK